MYRRTDIFSGLLYLRLDQFRVAVVKFWRTQYIVQCCVRPCGPTARITRGHCLCQVIFGVIRLFAAHCVFLQSVQAMQSFQRLKDPKHRSESATSVTFPNYSSSATSVSRKYCSKIDVIFPMTMMCFAVIVALL